MRLPLPFVSALLLGGLVQSPSYAADPRPHELGWLCVTVDDTDVAQVSAFNRDAPKLSIWVPKSRLFIEADPSGSGGRVCAPAVVRLGDGELPPETLVFERTVIAGAAQKPATAELVITPTSARRAEITTQLVGLPENWVSRDGTLTFQAPNPLTFPEKVTRGLQGEGEGPPPPDVFKALPSYLRFQEPCVPIELTEPIIASGASFDPRTGLASARGLEPFRLEAGTKLSRCEGSSMDTLMTAVAKPASADDDEDEASWFLISRNAKFKLLSPDLTKPAGHPDELVGADPELTAGLRFSTARPLGGYHVCRQPTWLASTLSEIPFANTWEITPDGKWRENFFGTAGAGGSIAAGLEVALLDYRDSWALIRVMISGAPRVVAVPAQTISMPSGPAADTIALDGGLCQVSRGQWRALKSNAQTFRVSQDTPGAELAGLWLEVPQGSRVLQMCQDGPRDLGKRGPNQPACQPIYVGGAQASETDRFVLVRYAGTVLAVRERDLRDRTTGEFLLRRERPWFYRADPTVLRDDVGSWVFGVGPGGRISFAKADNHAWTLAARLQRLTEKSLGFEGVFGVGGDGFSTFLSMGGGVSALLHRFQDAPLELRAGVHGQLDLRVSKDGGMNFNVIGKAQLRWVNELAPVSFELGLNLGYGGTFGSAGEGGVLFGMPIQLVVELVQF